MKQFYILFFMILFCIPINQLQSQIINIEDKRSNRSDTTQWFGSIDLGFNLYKNQSSTFTLKGGMLVEYLRMKHLFLMTNNFSLIKAESQSFVNQGFQHFRYNYTMNNWITYEAFLQGQYNEKILVKFRGLVGTGVRLRPFKEEKFYLGLSYMYQYEIESDSENRFRENRINSYFSFAISSKTNFRLAHTSYIQPLIKEFNDIRLSSQTSLMINLTDKLSFKSSFSITYDSRLPEELSSTFYSINNGIRWIIK